MEFFEFTDFIQVILDSLSLGNDLERAKQLIWQRMCIALGVGAGIYVIMLILGGIGVYTIAKRLNMKYPWLGFFPFVNTWYVGKIAGEAYFFGQKMKRAGLYAMLAEIGYVAVNIVLTVITFLLVPYMSSQPQINTLTGETVGYTMDIVRADVPAAFQWMYDGTTWFQVISMIFNLIMIVFLFVVFLAFFRKYYAKNPFIMTFLSAFFPFRGIVLFAVRKNPPVDYNEYMRRKMQMYAQMYGQPPAGPSQGGSTGGGTPPDPFPDHQENGGAQDDDPFSDF